VDSVFDRSFAVRIVGIAGSSDSIFKLKIDDFIDQIGKRQASGRVDLAGVYSDIEAVKLGLILPNAALPKQSIEFF